MQARRCGRRTSREGAMHARPKVVDRWPGDTAGSAGRRHHPAPGAQRSMRPSVQPRGNDAAASGAVCRRSFSEAPGGSTAAGPGTIVGQPVVRHEPREGWSAGRVHDEPQTAENRKEPGRGLQRPVAVLARAPRVSLSLLQSLRGIVEPTHIHDERKCAVYRHVEAILCDQAGLVRGLHRQGGSAVLVALVG